MKSYHCIHAEKTLITSTGRREKKPQTFFSLNQAKHEVIVLKFNLYRVNFADPRISENNRVGVCVAAGVFGGGVCGIEKFS